MEQINLSAGTRQQIGKSPSRRLRSVGKVPAVLYGPEVKEALNLTLDGKELERVLHTTAGENVIVNLSLEGEKAPKTVMFKEVTRHPLKETIQHVDLLEVLMTQNITVEIPIHLTGKAEGQDLGGIVQHGARKVKIECLPSAIPDSLDVDITSLGIGDVLHLRDVSLPEGVNLIDEPDTTVVSVVAPAAEVVVKTAEEVEAELAESFGEKEEAKEEKEGE